MCGIMSISGHLLVIELDILYFGLMNLDKVVCFSVLKSMMMLMR
jgi:hypothetical protein